ncbi:MAG: hypothetical protein AAF990_14915 [Bacteroidota bacterium]
MQNSFLTSLFLGLFLLLSCNKEDTLTHKATNGGILSLLMLRPVDSAGRLLRGIYLYDLRSTPPQLFTTDPFLNYDWSADNRLIYWNQQNSRAYVKQLDGREKELTSLRNTPNDLLSWSPNSQYVASVKRSARLIIVDPATDTRILNIENSDIQRKISDSQASWSADSQKLAFVVQSLSSSFKLIYYIDLATKEVVKPPIPRSENTFQSIGWSSDGSHIYYLDGNQFFSYNLQDETVQMLVEEEERVSRVSYAPDYSMAAITKIDLENNQQTHIVDLNTQQTKAVINGRVRDRLAWSNDSRKIAYNVRNSGNIQVLDLDDPNSTPFVVYQLQNQESFIRINWIGQ